MKQKTSTLQRATKKLFEVNITFEESQEIYKRWALDDSYDKLLTDQTVYSAPTKLTDTMAGLFPDPEKALVLDIGAGTGIIGECLLRAGFQNLHGLEPLREFVDMALEKNIYCKFFVDCIGGGSEVKAPNDTYDAIVSAGAYGPGAIPCDSFHEIIRLLKPGGYFVNCMRHEYLWTTGMYKDTLEPLAEQLEASGKWRKVVWEPFSNYFMGHEGLLMVFQVL